MITPEMIKKYIKIKALADKGAGGEKDNAVRILQKMGKDHPGIEAAVAAYLKAQQSVIDEETMDIDPWPNAQGNPKRKKGQTESKFGGNWENIFNFARSAMNNAYDFANHVANAYVGRQLAEEYVSTSIRENKSGNVSLIQRIPTGVLEYADSLNLVQKQAFRQVMHELLDDQLDTLLGTVDGSDEEEEEEEEEEEQD